MKKVIGVIAIVSLILSACGKEEKKESKPVEFGSKLTKGKNFLFTYNSKHSDINAKDKIKGITYIENGKGTTYNVEKSGLTLEKVANKNNSSLLKLAKKEDQHAFNVNKKLNIKMYENIKNLENISSGNKSNKKLEEAQRNIDASKSLKYVEPKKHDLKLGVSAKDNKAEKESVNLGDVATTYIAVSQSEYNQILKRPAPEIYDSSIKTKKINDVKFSGLQKKVNGQRTFYDKAVMKINDNNTKVKMDNPNTKNKAIDVTDFGTGKR